MTVKRPANSADAAIESIRLSLRTDVVDVLRTEISTLRSLPRNTAYETIMNQPTVLDACFRLMREKPQLFKQFANDQASPPVALDETMLQCGRSMGDVITLVVRAAARRYFRARLGQRRPKAVPKAGLMRRMALALNLQSATPTKRSPVAETPADRLYAAMRDYLQFDWQALLIPHYTPMTPQLVNRLGARLLDIREPAELKALAGAADGEGEGRTPLLLDGARRMIPAGSDVIDPDILWQVCQQMDLGRLYPNRDAAAIRRAVAQVAATQGEAVALMLPVLGTDIRRFTAFLMIAHAGLGEQRFRQVFGRGGQLKVVRRWMEQLAATAPPPPRLDEMKRVYQGVFDAGTAEPTAVDADGKVDRDRVRAELREAMQRLPSRAGQTKPS